MLRPRTGWALGCLLLAWLALCGTQAGAADDLPEGKWWHNARVIAQLKLNPVEIRQLDELFAAFRSRLIDLKDDVQRQQRQLDTILTHQKMDERSVQQQFRRLEDGRSRLASERLRFTVEVRRIIGPQRFQELKRTYRDFR
jgi:Spy/CpxP family protein refolding chaperone